MDQEALVREILEAGGRLDIALRSRGFYSKTAPLVALDSDSNQWTLLLGLPISASRRTIYYEIQDAIDSLDLALELDQVILVKEGDPGLAELRGSAVNEVHGMRRESVSVEIAGRHFTEARRVLLTLQAYEASLLAVLRQSMSDRWLLYQDFRPEASEAHGSRSLPLADFAIRNGDRWVLIEAKSYRRPASTQDVMEALGILTYSRHYLTEAAEIVLLFIVMGGVSRAAKREAQEFPEIKLIEWAPGQDFDVIFNALEESLG